MQIYYYYIVIFVLSFSLILKYYYKNQTADVNVTVVSNFKGGFNYFSAQYCQKYYLNICAKYMNKYH